MLIIYFSALLEIQSVEAGGVVSFQSKATGLYLAMDKKGRLYGTVGLLRLELLALIRMADRANLCNVTHVDKIMRLLAGNECIIPIHFFHRVSVFILMAT